MVGGWVGPTDGMRIVDHLVGREGERRVSSGWVTEKRAEKISEEAS